MRAEPVIEGGGVEHLEQLFGRGRAHRINTGMMMDATSGAAAMLNRTSPEQSGSATR
jgi:hypothetical protein